MMMSDKCLWEFADTMKAMARELEERLPKNLWPSVSPYKTRLALPNLSGGIHVLNLRGCDTKLIISLHDLFALYDSNRGETGVTTCLIAAVKDRLFTVQVNPDIPPGLIPTDLKSNEAFGLPGLTMADIRRAEKIAQEYFRRNGFVDITCDGAVPYYGSPEEYRATWKLADVPENSEARRIVEYLLQNRPRPPLRGKYVNGRIGEKSWEYECEDFDQFIWEECCSLIEVNWEHEICDCVPLHPINLRQPIFHGNEGEKIELHDNKDKKKYCQDETYYLNELGGVGRDYMSPSDWELNFVYNLWVISIITATEMQLAHEWISWAFIKRFSSTRKVDAKFYTTANDIRNAAYALADYLDAGCPANHVNGPGTVRDDKKNTKKQKTP